MIRDLAEVTEGRVCWPDNKPRAAQRIDGSFKGREATTETRAIEMELERWGIRSFVISRNHQRIYAGDPAAAVWWLNRLRELRVLACDKYKKLADNLHAIRLTLEAMRALERWGAYTAEQAAQGARLALPPPDEGRIDWPTVLGVGRDWPLAAVEAIWKTKAEKAHPDRGGSVEAIATINAAMDAARKELGAG